MIDVAQKRANRRRVMRMIYDLAEGSRLNWVSGQELLDASGLPDDELGDICQYLASEYMIEGRQTLWGHATFHTMRLLHGGIKEMESSADEPPEAAADDALDLGLVREVLRLFESSGEAIDLPAADKAQLAAEMRTVKAQVDSPRPNHRSIRQHLDAARLIVIGAVSTVAGAELLALINYVLQHH